jgi:hypothetical protein
VFQDLHKGPWEAESAVPDLAEFARAKGVKYFMISYTDLFGGQRAKLVPAQAIAEMSVEGAGFAGFATWLDLTPPMRTSWRSRPVLGDPASLEAGGGLGRRHRRRWRARWSSRRRATCCAA